MEGVSLTSHRDDVKTKNTTIAVVHIRYQVHRIVMYLVEIIAQLQLTMIKLYNVITSDAEASVLWCIRFQMAVSLPQPKCFRQA